MALIGSALFFIVSILFFSFLTWDYPLISPDEPRYAETAREMLASGNFIVPYLDGIPRLVKPVMFYWLQALSMKVFGVNEFAARFPSVVSAAGLVSLGFLFGSLNGIGFLTAIITMTSLIVVIASKLAITDMLLSFFITAALVFFYVGFDQNSYKKKGEAYGERSFSIWILLSIVMMGFGFLTKGPVALLLPVVIIFTFVFIKGDLLSFLKTFVVEIVLGALLFIVINLPWYCLIHIATNGEFTSQFFFSDNLNRFVKTHTAHSAPFWFYIPVIFLGLFPWSFFLIQSILAQDFSSSLSLKSEKSRQEQAFVFGLVWAIVVFVFFSLAQTKLPTYILPIFLPLCFFIARWWNQRFSNSRSNSSNNYGLMVGLVSFSGSILVVFLVYLFKFKKILTVVEPNAFLLPVIIICLIYLASTAIALTSVFSNAKISFIFFAVANSICLMLAISMVLKPYALHRDGGAKVFVQNIDSHASLKTLLEHPSRFSFYREKISSKLKPNELKDYFVKNPNGVLVLKTKDLDKLKKQAQKESFKFKKLESNSIYTYVKAFNPIPEPVEEDSLE